MITAARHFGNAKKVDLGASVSSKIHPSIALWWTINTSGAGASVTLPDPALGLSGYRLGGPMLIVAVVGTNSLAIKDSGGTTLATVAVGDAAFVSLLSKSGDGSWLVMTKDWS